MADYSELLPSVQSGLGHVLDEVAIREIQRAAVEFFEKSQVWQTDLTGTLPTVLNGNTGFLELKIKTPRTTPNPASDEANYVPGLVHDVEWITTGSGSERVQLRAFSLKSLVRKRDEEEGIFGFGAADSEAGFAYDAPTTAGDETKILFYPSEEVAGEDYYARLVLKPRLTDTELDDVLLEEYREPIEAGAIARLARQPNRPWTNGRAARDYADQMQEWIVESLRVAKGTHIGGPLVVQYNGPVNERGNFFSGNRRLYERD